MAGQLPTRIYVDTNILVSYLLGEKDEDFELAERVFQDVENGKYAMLISNFTLMETLHALRTIITRRKYQELRNGLSQSELINIANSKDFAQTVNEESMKAFKVIVDKITSDSQHFIFEPDTSVYPGEMFSRGLQILLSTTGLLRVFRFRCQKCNSYIRCSRCKVNSEIVYKEINAPDLIHLYIAEILQCEQFFTMDKYFANIPEKSRRIKIEVLEK